jgi:hypothetical protein
MSRLWVLAAMVDSCNCSCAWRRIGMNISRISVQTSAARAGEVAAQTRGENPIGIPFR